MSVNLNLFFNDIFYVFATEKTQMKRGVISQEVDSLKKRVDQVLISEIRMFYSGISCWSSTVVKI